VPFVRFVPRGKVVNVIAAFLAVRSWQLAVVVVVHFSFLMKAFSYAMSMSMSMPMPMLMEKQT